MNKFRLSMISKPSKFPVLPKLNAAQRSQLMSWLMLAREFAKEFENECDSSKVNDLIAIIELITSTLLEGCETVEEFLARDTSMKHLIFNGCVITIDGRIGSFICPNCGKQVDFPADDEHIEILRETYAADCCANCSPEIVGAIQGFINTVFESEYYG